MRSRNSSHDWKLADRLDELVDQKANEMNHKFPGTVKGAQQDEGVVLDCYRWFFRVALDAIGIGKGYVLKLATAN
jgi:hypothetical protein